MTNDTSQNARQLKEALEGMRINSLLKIGAALETPQGIRYRTYVAKTQNYMKGNKSVLVQINVALSTILFSKTGQSVAPEKVKSAHLILNTILGRSGDFDLNDEELSGIAGALQVLDMK